MKLLSKCALIKASQGPSDCLMIINYCGFHPQFWLQFFIQKGLEKGVFSLGKQRKIKNFKFNKAAWATVAILSYKTNNI